MRLNQSALLIAAPAVVLTVWCVSAFAQVASEPPKYTGPGSCSSASCHGGVEPRTESSVLQNEYSTWVLRDKHTQAQSVLNGPVAARMAKLLGMETAVAPKCLACHSLSASATDQGRTFDPADGVSCEACHGPASNWLGPHTTKNWTHERSLQAGMRDLRDPVKRAEQCLGCHLGAKEKFVDHEMIAAGHPDLHFELTSFSAVMPRHWKQPLDQDPWIDVRELAVGQAVQLRENLLRVARDAQDGTWPQYAVLDCFACHHSLTQAQDSWRQAAGYANRRPGNPPLNLSRYIVLRQIIRETDPAGAQRLEADMNKVYASVTALGTERSRVAAEASAAAVSADQLLPKLVAASVDRNAVLRMMKVIAGNGDAIAAGGERSAEQASMVMDALFVAYGRAGAYANSAAVRDAIRGLFDKTADSAYNAPKFALQLRTVLQLLPQ